MKINKIMVALVMSDHSRGIFKYAAGLATALDAELAVASVINKRDVMAVEKISTMGYEVDGSHYVEEVTASKIKQMDDLLTEVGFPHKNFSAVYKVGNPTAELLQIIIEENVDMVVMGIKGHSNLAHAFVGSVADKVFRRSPVTVVSYRDEVHAERLRKRINMEC